MGMRACESTHAWAHVQVRTPKHGPSIHMHAHKHTHTKSKICDVLSPFSQGPPDEPEGGPSHSGAAEVSTSPVPPQEEGE